MLAPAGRAQVVPPDTQAVRPLGPVTVTAERSPVERARITAAVTVMDAEDIDARPARTLADALVTTPGITFLGGDRAGSPPAATVRGFYGGGEADYVLLLVDGRPLNAAENGVVDWELVPLLEVERVEVLRGGASPLWGDAAIGAVVNIITPRGARPLRGRAAGGSYNTYSLDLSGGTEFGGHSAGGYGAFRQYGGFRDHGERSVGLLGGHVELYSSGDLTLGAATHHSLTSAESPGPVASSTGSPDGEVRATSSPFFRFDETDERRHDFALNGRWQAGAPTFVEAILAGRLRSAEVTRTLPLSPEFADTRRRDIDAGRAGLEVRATHEPPVLASRIVIGGSASFEGLESAYAPVATGTADDYAAAMPDPDAPADIRGVGSRQTLAAYLHGEVSPLPALRLVAGVRVDALRDRYDPTLPDSAEVDATHTAWSPRAGVNLQWLSVTTQQGHLYAQVGRHFKAPTLDQLFDQRTIPVPFPPFSVSLSNIGLDPQHGVAMEIGLYHRAELMPGLLALEGQLAVYRIDMEDEIDFSIEQFAYVNIGQSRHDGVEAGLGAVIGPFIRLDGSYAYQAARLRQGDYEGNYLKAIPRDVWSVMASAARGPARVSLAAHGANRIWLDDANTIPLEGWTAVDARLAYRLPGPAGDVTLTVDAYNLFDSEYSTTGFPDASGSSVVYYFPSAGRQLLLGLTVTL